MKALHRKRPKRQLKSSISEPLEARSLLSATLLSALPSQTLFTANGADNITLSTYFNDPAITGTVVRFTTNFGNIDLLLDDQQKPTSVQNFLSYVNGGEYNGTIIHRSGNLSTQSNSAPVQIIQGGFVNTSFSPITTKAAITNEGLTNGVNSNLTGTIAYARSSDPNSATSQWYINTTDNTELDPTSSSAGYVVFGTVINGTMSTVNAMAAVARYDLSGYSSLSTAAALSQLPVQNFSQAQVTSETMPPASDLEEIQTAAVIPALTYTASTTNSNVATAAISNGMLTVSPVANGTANITVTATDTAGMSVMSTFAVTVTNGSAATITIGAGGSRQVSYNDSDGTTGVFRLTGPGSAVVNFNGTGINPVTHGGNVVIESTTDSVSSIVLTGTTSASTLTVSTSRGTRAITIGSISGPDLRTLNARGVTFSGAIDFTGSVAALNIAGASGGQLSAQSVGTVTAGGGFGDTVALSATGADLNRFSASAIIGGTWTFSGSANTITTKSASGWTIDATGAINAINVTGPASMIVGATSIGSLTVRGDLTNSSFSLTGSAMDLGRMNIAGAVNDSIIDSAGGLGLLMAGQLNGSRIYAGANTQGNALPSSAPAFSSDDSITLIKLKNNPAGDSFSNSDIAAEALGRLYLGTILTSNGGQETGVAASSIALLNGTIGSTRVNATGITASNVASVINGLSLGDFVVKMF